MYPSDPVQLQLYGTIKFHKLEKNYAMKTMKTSIWNIQNFVEIIQATLNKNYNKIQNSTSFLNEAKTGKLNRLISKYLATL